MKALPRLLPLLVAGLLLATPLRAQEDPLKDPDLQEALKQAQEFQKKNPPVKMSDLQKQAAEIQAEQKKQEAKEKAALKKQAEAPGPVALPDWTPATPQFKANGTLAKKVVDEEVRILQTGTSTLSPKEVADAWLAAIAEKPINHSRNDNLINGNPSVILFLSTRSAPREEVRMEARRDAGDKVTKIEISSPLPKPEDEND